MRRRDGFHPFQQFDEWMQVAVSKETFEPNAMTLATVSENDKQKMCYMCKNSGYESMALIPIRAEGNRAADGNHLPREVGSKTTRDGV